MKTAILTGFQAFGNYAVNPTEILASHQDGKVLVGHRIRSMVFPPTVLSPSKSLDHGKEIVEKASSLGASVIISLGIASEAKGVRVETECMNWVENDKYCTAFENRKPIFNDRTPHEKRHVPLQAWDFEKLSRGLSAANIPLEMSTNAGRYCCNALMFRVLRALESFPVQPPFVFAHISCTEEAICKIPDFDRADKVLLCQSELQTIVEKFLESYS